jgi:hypothetical protein
LAEEYLEIYGPRRFISFIQRCQKDGPWREKISITRKVGNNYRKVQVGQFEHELTKQRKLLPANLEFLPPNLDRIEELNNLMSESLSEKSESELDALARKWISDQMRLQS